MSVKKERKEEEKRTAQLEMARECGKWGGGGGGEGVARTEVLRPLTCTRLPKDEMGRGGGGRMGVGAVSCKVAQIYP